MHDFPLWLNIVVFLVAGAVIWWAGTRLERVTEVIADRTGFGGAFTGLLLLATVTSLPELAATITAIVYYGDSTLAINNLLGGVALQTFLLVVADAVKRRKGALTYFSPNFGLLIQGTGLILLLLVTVAGITAEGKPEFAAISLWMPLQFLVYLAILYLSYHHRSTAPWAPTDHLHETEPSPESEDTEEHRPSLRRAWFAFAGLGVLVLAAGWLATASAEALAEQTGLGSAFVGATLLALATSLPEVSTTISAARRDNYDVAVANIFGSNAFDVTLLVLAELLYREGTILADARSSGVFVALIGAAMTCFYLLGLMERQNRTILSVGWDSAAAAVVYIAGMSVLYTMR